MGARIGDWVRRHPDGPEYSRRDFGWAFT